MPSSSKPSRIIHTEYGYKDLIKSVAVLRKKRGIPQTELDRIVGCADGYVAKCECGTRTPSAFMLWCFADALKADLKVIPRNE